MDQRAEVTETIVARLSEVLSHVPQGDLRTGANLLDLGLNSKRMLETLIWLEGEFDVPIPDDDLDLANFDSVAKMAEYVLRHRA
jgi:acyl carrier protein